MRKYLLIACSLFFFFSLTLRAQIVFDKPKEKPPLENPYTLNLTREDVSKGVQEVLQSCKIDVDKDQTKFEKGAFVTKYFVFTRGLNTKTDLEHISNLPASDARNWLRGRYYLEILALPLDNKRAQLQIIAHIQGQMADVAGSKWIDSPSNGQLEEEVLRGIAGKILGLDLNPKPNMKRRLLDCEY